MLSRIYSKTETITKICIYVDLWASVASSSCIDWTIFVPREPGEDWEEEPGYPADEEPAGDTVRRYKYSQTYSEIHKKGDST